ncbi:MAG TPA: carboxypeptidase regulatory-like domain-containing protein [Anaerolineae bacterium]|nr:carboxypeptidase regulatory-like domain-containing protein [Anaerolineae bacterium]HQI83133.1 carboxypeptidase regulatory-like domain-containing protein [Anaerolineae bacterium]
MKNKFFSVLLNMMLIVLTISPTFLVQAMPLSAETAIATPPFLTLVNQIGGATYSVKLQGNYAYMGVGPRLVILNITNPVQPVAVGQTEIISDYITDIEISGNYAYITSGSIYSGEGLRIIDISNPAQPHIVGFYDTPGKAQNLAIAGNYAYVADGSTGLRIIDVSNPSNPIEVKAIIPPNTSTGGKTTDVVIVDHYAYVAENYEQGLHILDISNPANPVTVGRYAGRPVHGVAVAGNYAYLACVGSLTTEAGLSIVNISNPAAPQEVGFYKAEFYSTWVRIKENYAYLSTSTTYPAPTKYVRIVNVANPTVPVLSGVFSLPYDSNDLTEPYQVDLTANLAYLAAGMYGLQIVNVANPAAPTVVGAYNIPTRPGAIAAGGNHLYVADEHWTLYKDTHDVGDLHIMDITNPTDPHIVGIYDTPGIIDSIAVSGTYAFAGKDVRYDFATSTPLEGGMHILNVSDPAHPAETAFYDSGRKPVTHVALQGDLAYLYLDANETGNGGIRFVDISTLANPQDIGHYDYDANDLAIAGNYAYLGGFGLSIINIADPANPSPVGQYDSDQTIAAVAVSGDYAYIGDYRLQIIAISDPANPTLAGSLSVGSGYVINDIEIVGSRAYLAVGGYGFYIVDISDPQNPVEVARYSTLGVANSIAVSGNTVYFTSETGGIYIFASPPTISGTVTDARGKPVAGAVISANSLYTATTDASGIYTFTNVLAGHYTLTPVKNDILWWEPAQRTITVPPDATKQDFTGYHIRKSVMPGEKNVIGFGDVLTYTVQVSSFDDGSFIFYDPIPIYTTYIAESLHAPEGINYDTQGNMITGTLSTLTANEITFAVRVGITGTAGFAPPIVNRACIFPTGQSTELCEWSNTTRNSTYLWKVYLPLVMRNRN